MNNDDQDPVPRDPQDPDGAEDRTAAIPDEPANDDETGVGLGWLVEIPAIARAMEESTAGLRRSLHDMMRSQQEVHSSLDGMQEVARAAMEAAGVREQIERFVAASLPDLSALAPRMHWPELQVVADAMATLQRGYEQVMPGNWKQAGLDYSAIVPVIHEGTPLVWVPSAEVIQDLLAAPDDTARAGILVTNKARIIASCRGVLAEVTLPELKPQAEFIAECLAMAEAQMMAGAQALAASVWDTVYRGICRAQPDLQGKQGRFDSYKRVASRLPQVDPDESTILEFRQACVLAPFVSACEDFWAPDPVPASFNRHATVHAAGPTQYTEANALTAIMLAVSVLRELQEGNLRCTLHI
ncbi:hypothetical protein ABZS68_24990 [Streptomyces sp. NPDC005571]|uniref:hypothetical protein n=1 Tax=unclassified Streptomyces TaxID=2593676 RepID=UPI0033B02374